MKKMKLDLDQIQVVSFAVETTEGSAGTIHGFSPDTDIGCGNGVTEYGSNTCRFCYPDSIWDIC